MVCSLILQYINFHIVSILVFTAFMEFLPKLQPFRRCPGISAFQGLLVEQARQRGCQGREKGVCDNVEHPEINSKSAQEMRQEIICNL